MSDLNSTDVLNRLLAILQGSFLKYLTYAHPFTRSGDEAALETLAHIVADQQAISERISAAVDAAGGRIVAGEFSNEFTGQNDLALEFLLRRAVEYQRRDITAIEAYVADLAPDPAARSLAEEALGMAKGHLESLEEAITPVSSS